MAIAARIVMAVMGLDRAGTGMSEAESAPAGSPAPIQADLAVLQSMALFSGKSGDTRVVARQVTAGSSLNLVLQGVMLGGQPQASLAVIVSNARQASYHPGDALPGAGSIVLDSIAADHVVVDNNGRKETLWLDPDNSADGSARQAPPAPAGAEPLEVTGRLVA